MSAKICQSFKSKDELENELCNSASSSNVLIEKEIKNQKEKMFLLCENNDLKKTLLLLVFLPIFKNINHHYNIIHLNLKYLDNILVEIILTWKIVFHLISQFKQDFRIDFIFDLDFKSIKFWKTVCYILIPLQIYISLKILFIATDGIMFINKFLLTKAIGVLLGISAFKVYWNKLIVEIIEYCNKRTDYSYEDLNTKHFRNIKSQSIIVEYDDIDNSKEEYNDQTQHPSKKLTLTSTSKNISTHPITRTILSIKKLLKTVKKLIISMIIQFFYDIFF